MKREAVYDRWAPAGAAWSLWVRPALFATMDDDGIDAPRRDVDVGYAPAPNEGTALLLDLPGDEGVWAGVALAARGYAPVPVYETCTGPHEAIDQSTIIGALRAGASSLGDRRNGPPAFLLDARRMNDGRRVRPGAFDNRWMVSPFDFPSAAYLRERGVSRVLLAQRGRRAPREDVARVLRAWGVETLAIDVAHDVAAALEVPAEPARSAREGFGMTR